MLLLGLVIGHMLATSKTSFSLSKNQSTKSSPTGFSLNKNRSMFPSPTIMQLQEERPYNHMPVLNAAIVDDYLRYRLPAGWKVLETSLAQFVFFSPDFRVQSAGYYYPQTGSIISVDTNGVPSPKHLREDVYQRVKYDQKLTSEKLQVEHFTVDGYEAYGYKFTLPSPPHNCGCRRYENYISQGGLTWVIGMSSSDEATLERDSKALHSFLSSLHFKHKWYGF